MKVYTIEETDIEPDGPVLNGSLCTIQLPDSNYIVVNNRGDIRLYDVYGELKAVHNFYDPKLNQEID
jgi:hypothetical protein